MSSFQRAGEETKTSILSGPGAALLVLLALFAGGGVFLPPLSDQLLRYSPHPN